MKKAILPSKTFLVCSSGMKKTEMVVFSQQTVRAEKTNRLVATVDDRFGDFFCKHALILGALIVGIMAATGGLAIAMAAVAVAAIGVSLSMCAIVNLFNGGGWKNYHPSVRIEGKNALLDKSYFSCPIGGTIIAIYDKNIANQQAAVFRNKAFTEIAMHGISGFLFGQFGVYCIANQVGALGFFGGVGAATLIDGIVSKGQDYVEGEIIDPYTESQKNSPIYNENIHGTESGVEAPSGDTDGAGMIAGANKIQGNKESIIAKGTQEAMGERVNPQQKGTLNNPLNKNKFDKEVQYLKRKHGKHKYKKTSEGKQLLRKKEAYNQELGKKAYKREHIKNIKTGVRGILNGFNPKTSAGQTFWGTNLYETISDIIIANEQKKIMDASISAEAIAKAKIGIYAKQG